MQTLRTPSRPLRALTVILIAGLVAAAADAAPANRWRPIGPAGGPGGALASAPSRPGRVYAGGQTLLRSDDAGRHWAELPGTAFVNALVVDPGDPDHVVAATLAPGAGYTQAGVVESVDGGMSFHPLAALPRRDGFPAAIATLRFGFDGTTLYAGSTAGLLLLRPDGEWQTLGLAGETVYALAFDPRNSDRLLAAAWGAISRTKLSRDGGVTWTTVLGEALYDDIVFDPIDPRRVYGSGNEGYRSLDGGRTWARMARDRTFRGLAVDRAGVVYGATGAGVSRSDDHGKTWTPAFDQRGTYGRPQDAIDQVVALDDGAVLASGQRGIWRSDDAARSFVAASAGVLRHSMLSLAVGGDGVLYASDQGVFRTRNRGASWTFEGRGLSRPLQSPTLGVAPTDSATVYAGIEGYYHLLARTFDAGEHWEHTNYPGSQPVATVAVDPSDPRVVLVGGPETNDHYESRLCHVMRSEDAGDSWRCLSPDSPELYEAQTIVFHALAPESLLAATCCSFLRSDDRGLTWRRIAASVEDSQQRGGVGFTSVDGRGVVLSSDGTVYVSRDGGRTVVRGGRGLPAGAFFAGLVADPRRPREVYVAALRHFGYRQGLGVFVSLDGGMSFARLGDGLPPEFNGALALDAQHGVLYAGTFGRSVWRFDLPAVR